MSAKQITVPLEVYVRLQELASLAGYSYREAEEGTERTWDLTNDEGASLLDERGAIRPEAAELYFTLMPSSPTNSCSSSRPSWRPTARLPSPPRRARRFVPPTSGSSR